MLEYFFNWNQIIFYRKSGKSVLPEKTYADPAALSESTETKPLLAVNIREHKGKILSHLVLGNAIPEGKMDTLATSNWHMDLISIKYSKK